MNRGKRAACDQHVLVQWYNGRSYLGVSPSWERVNVMLTLGPGNAAYGFYSGNRMFEIMGP